MSFVDEVDILEKPIEETSNSILFGQGKLEFNSDTEFRNFVYLMFAIKNYKIKRGNKPIPFFKRFLDTDLHSLLKLSLAKYNTKVIKKVENHVREL